MLKELIKTKEKKIKKSIDIPKQLNNDIMLVVKEYNITFTDFVIVALVKLLKKANENK